MQPCWVRIAAAALAGSDARVVTVAGFPHGCDRAEVKALAAAMAVADGAAEVDMVQNFGALKSGHATVVAAEIAAVVRAVPGIPVKVILETAALTDAEKELACRLAVDAGAAFVKTSTGFHPAGGATVADVRLLRAAVGTRDGRQGVRRDPDARRRDFDDRGRRQPHRHVGERGDPRIAIALNHTTIVVFPSVAPLPNSRIFMLLS